MHEEGLLTRAKRSREGRGNNPYEYTAIQPTDLVGKRATRIQNRLNAIYWFDRHVSGQQADVSGEPVRITVGEAAND